MWVGVELGLGVVVVVVVVVLVDGGGGGAGGGGPVVPPWEETLAHWTHRARRVTRAINREYNVAGLCREFPQRLADVVERQGDRLPK